MLAAAPLSLSPATTAALAVDQVALFDCASSGSMCWPYVQARKMTPCLHVALLR
jgi:hypothetical protein